MNHFEISRAKGEGQRDGAGILGSQFPASTFALRNVLRVLLRRRVWILGFAALSVALAFGLTSMMRPTYEATATIELNKSGGESLDLGLGDALGQQSTSGGEGLLTDLQTETAILEGDSLALAVIDKLGLSKQEPFAAKPGKDPEAGLPLDSAPGTRSRLLAIFRGHLRVQPVRGTRLIRVTFEGHDPQQAALIANALIESYKSQYLQSHYEASSDASGWLTKQLSELKSNVEDSEKKLTDFEKQSGILSLQTGGDAGGDNKNEIHSVVIQKLDALNSELTAAEANRIQKEAIYHIVKGGDPDAVLSMNNNSMADQTKSLVFTEGGGTANLERLREQQNQIKLELAQASATYGPNNRHMKDLETQAAGLDKQIRQEMGEIIKRAHADMDLAEQTEAEIRRRFSGQQDEASKLNEKTVEFAVLSQEAGSQKKLYEDLYTKLQEANVSAGIQATNITTVDPARAQSSPVRPRLTSNLALGLLFGLLGGLTLAFTVDTLDRTVVSPLEVEEITGMPVIGMIPIFGDRPGYGAKKVRGRRSRRRKSLLGESQAPETIWMLGHPDSIAAEGFRSLRTSILLSRPGGGPRVILVTSCIPGEGKSTVTANLAVSFAQHGKKVLIMEADMRRPSLKHVMDVPNEAGLSNVLAGSAELEAVILRGVQVPTLDVLPAGPRPPMPSELLGSAAFDVLMEQIRSRYDIVLIDSPPALLLTDAVSIASKTDAVVWVARAGTVTRPQLMRAAQTMERNAMPIIGFALNGIDASVDPYGYGYGYGYGYDYKHYGAYFDEEKSNEA